MNIIGLDLGGTKLASAIFDLDGNIIIKDISTLERRSGREVGELMTQRIRALLSYAVSHNLHIDSIGVSVPGIYRRNTGTVWAPNIPGWEDYPLLEELNRIKPGELNITIDNDRACYILGEVWCGAAKGCTNAIFMAAGTGIGLGILADGRIIRGANDIAGATGWMALDRPYKPGYKACGCFEYNASGEGLARFAMDLLNSSPDYAGRLREINPAVLSAYDIFEAFDLGDELAIRVIDNAVEMWGMALANYVSLFNPQKIILGGGIFGPALRFLERIKEETRKWAQPISINYVDIVPSGLGGDAGLYGAGFVAIRKEL